MYVVFHVNICNILILYLFAQSDLLNLMHDLKEEGNALFKEEQYDIAWMHYRNAIFVVSILGNRFYCVVEKEFTSTLFSNRAFCCLKKVSLI